MKKIQYVIALILLIYVIPRSFLEHEKLKIEDKFYTKTSVYVEAQKNANNFFYMNEAFLPSDLITFLPRRVEFLIQIQQGTLDPELKSQFYPLSFFPIRNLISDYPMGKLYFSKNFSPFDEKGIDKFKKYFDVFAHTFKLTLNPFFDRTSYITYKDNKIMIDTKEIPCNTHLDAIKETLSHDKWEQFEHFVNYSNFCKSDFKIIKYHITNYENKVVYDFEIISRDLNQSDIYYENDDENKKLKNYNNENIVKLNISNYISTKRYLEEIQISFDDFILHHIIIFPNKQILNSILSKSKTLEIIELLPTKSMIPKYGTLRLKLFNQEKLVKNMDVEELIKYFNVSFTNKIEDKYPDIPFTYEKKTSSQLNIKYFGGLNNFDKIEIEITLRKQLMNFESIYNPQEFGFTFPSGIIIIGNEYTVTNHIYYNMPNVDVTMPFNIISLSWFVYGFMFVQIIKIFLGKSKSKGILESIKDRFVAKWGWLWKRY